MDKQLAHTSPLKIKVPIAFFILGIVLLMLQIFLRLQIPAIYSIFKIPNTLFNLIISFLWKNPDARTYAFVYLYPLEILVDFLLLGLVISLIWYKKYQRVLYLSFTIVIPFFFYGLFELLVSDFPSYSFILNLISVFAAVPGYLLGIYLGSRLKK